MLSQTLFEQIALWAGAAVCAALVVQVWPQRRSLAGAAFIVMMLAVCLQTTSLAIWLALPPRSGPVALAQIGMAAPDLFSGAFVVFALTYAGRREWLKSPIVLVLLLADVASVILILANDLHPFFVGNLREMLLEGAPPLDGVWRHVEPLGNLLSTLLAAGVLASLAIHVPRYYRSQASLIALAGVLPVTAGVVQAVLPRGAWQFHLLPLVFPAAGLLMAVAVRRFAMLDLLPVARDLVFTHMADAIMVVDGQGRVADLNERAAGLLGTPVDKAIGRPMTLFTCAAPGLEPVLACPVPGEHQFALETDGRTVHYAVQVSQIGARADDAGGSLVLLHDVTALKEAEIAFRKANDELQELARARDDLTHMIVHDLRTPLTSVMSGLKTLKLLGDLGEEQAEMLDLALAGSEALLGMINDLLDVTKMEAGAMQLERRPVEPRALAEEACRQVEALTQASGQRVIVDVAPELPPIEVDSGLIGRALVNLLGNANRFTPEGGTITVAAGPGSEGRILFRVRDTGIGIPAEARGYIFDKFGQVGDRLAGRTASTGLGLTFCKLAVEAHGGSIGVTSEEGEGSTFWFELPIKPEE